MRDFCLATCQTCAEQNDFAAPVDEPLFVPAVRAHFQFTLLCCEITDADLKAQLLGLRALWDELLPEL
eukprot:82886-Amphidinium_carterae.1